MKRAYRGHPRTHNRVKCLQWQPPGTNSSATRVLASGSWGSGKNAAEVRLINTENSSVSSMASLPLLGDVNSVHFISLSKIAVASSTGTLSVLDLSFQEDEKTNSTRPSLQLSASQSLSSNPLTSLDSNRDGSLLACSGEDGTISIMQTNNLKVLDSIDRCFGSVYALKFNGPRNFLTVGVRGLMHGWDLREIGTKPNFVCSDTYSKALTSVCTHPSRPSIVCTGSVNGLINCWDIRKFSTPTCTIQVHNSTIWDTQFLQSNPTKVATCGEDGQVLLIDFNKDGRPPNEVSFSKEQNKNLAAVLLYQADLPYNCLDFEPFTHTLCCGSDSGILFTQRIDVSMDTMNL